MMICECDKSVLQKDSDKFDPSELEEIPRIDSRNISYDDFFRNYLLLNKPCIITNITDTWYCSSAWVDNGEPNLEYLRNKYGNSSVCVSNCNTKIYNVHESSDMLLKDYMDYWKKYNENLCVNDAKNNHESKKKLQILYLKDWHLRASESTDFYIVPQFFSSDWLNEYNIDKNIDDYRFVYMGPSNTWSPFHVDVFTSFSWSVNVCGQKRWHLFPPGEEKKIMHDLRGLPFDLKECDHNQKYFDVLQNAGEAIFVPSCWHHQVWNLKNTISINHNWLNSCNIENMWNNLLEHLEKVRLEIEDCKEYSDNWQEDCQVMLKASYGMDFKMFYDFIYHIARKRIECIQNKFEIKQFDMWVLGQNHALFDLKMICKVLKLFCNEVDYKLAEIEENHEQPENLLSNIELILKLNSCDI